MALFCSFLWLSSIPLYIWTTSSLPFLCNGHLGRFHVLATVIGAAGNIGVPVSFWIMVFASYMPRSGIAGSYGSLSFFFFKYSWAFFSLTLNEFYFLIFIYFLVFVWLCRLFVASLRIFISVYSFQDIHFQRKIFIFLSTRAQALQL